MIKTSYKDRLESEIKKGWAKTLTVALPMDPQFSNGSKMATATTLKTFYSFK